MPAKTKGAGGPKTDEGKALVGQNAVRHGAMSLTVPPAELAAYGVHLAGVLASLAPVGYLEERLAERVAMSLWRMRRLELWEAATLNQAQAKALRAIAVSDVFDRAADPDTPAAALSPAELRLALKALELHEEEVRVENPDAMRKVAADRRARGELLRGLENLKTPATPRAFKEILTNDGAVCDLVYGLIDRLRARGVENAAISVAMGAEPEADPLDLCDWSAHDLAGIWNLTHETCEKGDQDHETPGWFARLEGFDQTRKADRLEELAARAQELADQGHGLSLVPSDADQARFQRYDAHLERTLYKALHELEAMQERRAGGATPLARVEVHGAV